MLNPSQKIFYSVIEIQNKKGTVETAGGAEKNSSGLSPTDSTSINNISDNFENVNTKNEKFSLKGEKWDSSTENNSDSIDNSSKKRNNKRSYYNEQESLFMMWSNSHNTEIGSTKAFTRFGKQHFYEKTESGVIEISKTQFYEKGDKIYEENYGRTRRSVYANSDRNGNEQRGHDSPDSVYGHAGEDERNTLYIQEERLQNDLAGNLQRRWTDSEEVRLNEDDKRSIKDVEDIDIKYSKKYNKGDNAFSKALTAEEWIKYNSAITTGVDAGLRINDHSLLVECEKGDYSYKLVIYDNTFEEKPIQAVYGIGNDSYSNTTIHKVAKVIAKWEDEGYGRSFIEHGLRHYAEMHGIVLGKYSEQTSRYSKFRTGNIGSRANTQKQSNGGTVSSGTQKIGKQSLKDNTDVETSSIIDTSSTRYILSEALKGTTLILKHLYSSIRCF